MGNVLPVCYLPPVDYFVAMSENPVMFEVHEHFIKQTYRNRCSIYGANGKLNLVIPVQHTGERAKMKDIRIANEIPWKKIHWRSIESAYRTSSYFEFYEPVFAPYYHKQYEFLLDFNLALLKEILKILQMDMIINTSDSYQTEYTGMKDSRNYFSPKNEKHSTEVRPYPQVFSDKYGFIPNLSIVDLIFNAGPGAKSYFN